MTIIELAVERARRAKARKPRQSKNGTPEEREKQRGHDWKPGHRGNNPLRARIISVSRAVTLVGKAVHRRHNFDPSTLDETARKEWMAELRDGAQDARQIADECDKAIVLLGGSPRSVKATDMLRALKAAFTKRFAEGKSVDQIFDELEATAPS